MEKKKPLHISDVYVGMMVEASSTARDNNKYIGEVVRIDIPNKHILVKKDERFSKFDYEREWACQISDNGLVCTARGAWDNVSYLSKIGDDFKVINVYVNKLGEIMDYDKDSDILISTEQIRDEVANTITIKNVIARPKYRGIKAQSESKNYIVSDRTFGVEFECTCSSYDIQENVRKLMPSSVDAHGDGSLRGGCGMEYVTPILKNEAGENYIHAMSEILTDGGYYTNDSCGTHIHIGVENDDSYKTQYRLSRLALLYKEIDIVLHHLVPTKRRKNSYCGLLCGGSYDMADTLDKMKKDDASFYKEYYNMGEDSDLEYNKGRKEFRTRYKGINMNSIGYRGTVEIRYHQGTIDSKEIMYWIDFNAGIIDYVFKNPNTVKMLAEDIEKTKSVKTKLFKLLEELDGFINPQTVKEIKKRFTKYNRVKKTCAE